MTVIIRFLNIILAGLIAGALFVIWIGYDPKNLSAQAYVEQQQNVIKALNTLMPILGLIAIILTVSSAFIQKSSKFIFGTLLLAAVMLIIGGLVTRFGNQPINSLVMTWKLDNIPSNWLELRDKWCSLNLIRTAATFLAFCLIVFANVRKR